MTLINHPRMSHPFQRGGPPVDPRGGGVPVCNKHQGEGEPRRGGRDESPFPRRVGSRDESPREGWGDRNESSKRGDKGGEGLHQSQPRGGGGGQLWPFKTQYLLRRF